MALNLRNLIFLMLIALGGAAVLLALFSEGIIPNIPFHIDKLGHFLAFAVASSICCQLNKTFRNAALIMLGIFAVASEYAQNHYFPQRQFSLLDISANLTGIGGALIYLWLKSRRKLRNT